MTLPVSSSPLLRLLIVEDNLSDAVLAVHELERSGRRMNVVRVDTREAFLTELANSPDIILCDYNLPAFSAPEALELLIQQGLDIPFIVLSGSIGEETAVDMIKRGADDYLLKDRIGRLDAAVERALEQKILRAEARRSAEHLRQSELKYRCLFDHLMDAAYLCDAATTRIIDMNRRGERLLGLERSVILGSRLGQYFKKGALDRLRGLPPDDADASVKFAAELSAGRGGRVEINAAAVTIPPRNLLLVLVRTPEG